MDIINQSPPSDTAKSFSPFQIKRSLQVNILVAFAALLITTVLIIIGYTYQQNSRAILQLSDDLLNQVTETVMETTTNYLTPAASIAQASSQIPNIEALSLVESKDLETYGMQILEMNPQLSGFFIGNEQGDFLFTKRFQNGSIGTQTIDRSADPPLRTWVYRDGDGNINNVEETTDFTYDPRARPWYGGAKDVQARYWTDIYIFFTDQKPGITAAYPIIGDDGNLVGVIGIDVALDQLSQFLETQTIGDNGTAFIINSEAEIVAYPGIALATQVEDKFRPLHISELNKSWVQEAFETHQQLNQSRFTLDSGGQRYIASFVPFPDEFGKDWKIGIVVPENDFVGSIKETNQISLLISGGILLLAIVSAIFISRSISKPIVSLTEETRKIKEFDLESDVVIHSPIQEVQTLGESIAAMKTSIKAFRKYVPDELVRQLILTGEDAQLGGHKKELTILFTDVAGFTTISEGMMPEALMLQLSDYLGALTTIVREESGTVDKYMGDGLLAFWGAPLPNPNHVADACRAALRCRDKVSELNKLWAAKGNVTFPTRIGLHTGETLVGNVGSAERMNYTVLGDSVNLASRLEPANAVYQTDIIVSLATYSLVSKQFHFRPLDIVTVKGKKQGVLLYELVGEVGEISTEKVLLCEQFTEGFDAYLNRQWDTALEIFQSLVIRFPRDRASQIYLARCKTFANTPPGPDWEPITDLSAPKQLTALPEAS
ncbi:MAG: adenylate/guanylate cyclase domain-containing protein [Chloroflexota bacterium]